ncbi:NAD-dependent epimerase/dehydratase family protein [Arthrobacter sp. I2-34]|uniref:NAD-dependent epimerase/dehydratase family protein n=1 Tax=Arthrobacter hankyongi TaxID=2904801 RepID=A0ABS9L3S4_9MICC|nr:NAD-dependent epimerase/dehydratase family protein [Arthrobacter hankyongi]MCG2621308.1 NAD-dependent epimerase/dehydratase family protein [Arthrobacter hankyongi]
MKALLVGGSGGTGMHLARGLTDRGYEVTILHRGVHETAEIQHYRHIHADPHFADQVREAIGSETFDLVMLTYGRLEQLARVFAGRCQRLLAVGAVAAYAGFLDPAAAVPAGTRLLAAESSLPAGEGPVVNEKAAAFGRKVVAAERAVLEEHGRGSYSATLFRYPTIYGPHAVPIPATSEWSYIKRLQDRRPIILLPHGGLACVTRCAAVNAAHAVLLALDTPASAGEIFNVADDDQYSHSQWAEMIMDVLGERAELVGLPQTLNWAAGHLLTMGGTTSTHMLVDSSKARHVLGYRDKVSARDALAQTVAWVAQNPPSKGVDPFDYVLEDQVFAALTKLADDVAPLKRDPEVTHAYAHPKAPGGQADHRGR